MYRSSMLILYVLFSFSSQSQGTCFPEGIQFITQLDIDNFFNPDCSCVIGDVTIGPSTNIYNLSGLNQLDCIGGDLRILECESLNNLTGLENLSGIEGDLYIQGNDHIINLNGLEDLSEIGGSLILENNHALSGISSLENLTSINGALILRDNIALTSLQGLGNVDPESINGLALHMNTYLSTCEVQSICDYLENSSNIAVISGNALGCAVQSEIENACDAALSVEWINFTISRLEEEAQLNWITASEENNKGFSIERKTAQQNWTSIGFVEGIGTTREFSEYHFLDANPDVGNNYYRLKQIDFDGAFEYSKIVVISFLENGPGISIFPNPASDALNIQVNESAEERELQILDQMGRLVYQDKILSDEALKIIPVSPFSDGVYSVSISSTFGSFIERVIIQKLK